MTRHGFAIDINTKIITYANWSLTPAEDGRVWGCGGGREIFDEGGHKKDIAKGRCEVPWKRAYKWQL